MFKPKTIIILLISLLAGLIAVKAFSLVTRPKSPPAPKAVPRAEKQAPPVHKGYSDSVPKGRRVVSIMVNEVSGATRALERGDRVDVIAVTDVPGSRGGKIARVVLQNVIVHDVEQSYFKKQLTDKVTRKKKTWTLQLLVSLPQAVTLASVDEAALLRLVLRNPEDDAIETAATVFYSPKTGAGPAKDISTGLPARILPGMRAISLPVNNQDGLCDSISPGDRVDVVVSFKLGVVVSSDGQKAEGTSATYTNTKKASRIFLQDIEVLDTGPKARTYEQTEKQITRVILMMTPKQAEKITVITDASQSSEIRLILRNTKDRQKIATRGEMFQDQIIKDKRPFKVIYTIKGTKVIPGKFYE